MTSTSYPFEAVLSEEETRGLSLVDVWVADIEPKDTSRVLKLVGYISAEIASKELDHLKRIRKISDPLSLTVLIATVSSLSKDRLQSYINDANLEDVIVPKVIQVCRYAPLTREQYTAWKDSWPMYWRESTVRRDCFSEEDVQQISDWMRIAIQEARNAIITGLIPVGAVIVDPGTKSVLARSHDCRHIHPLNHAVLTCINQVAEREREQRLQNTETKDKDEVKNSEKVSVELADNTPSPSKSTKRKSEEFTDCVEESKSYLCTNYIAVLTHEPCVMCSMALLHSRIAKVYYAMDSPEYGGLGSVYKLHTDRRLNHKFKVYKGLLKEEVKDLIWEGSS